MKIAFFDTKSYWVDAFKPVAAKYGYEITFFNERLTPATAHLAAGHDATCSFVNDEVPAEVIRELKNLGIKVLLLRCAGFDSVDLDVAKECVELGLAQVKPWGHLGDVAAAINEHAKANGYSVVREVGGHGIGLEFHETPFVSYVIKKGTGMVMAPGMVFTIESMINAGLPDIYIDEGNNWTIYTDDDSYSAQWEIMVHVTEDGYEVMSY